MPIRVVTGVGSLIPDPMLKSSTGLLSVSFTVKIDMRITDSIDFDSNMSVYIGHTPPNKTLVLILGNLNHQ